MPLLAGQCSLIKCVGFGVPSLIPVQRSEAVDGVRCVWHAGMFCTKLLLLSCHRSLAQYFCFIVFSLLLVQQGEVVGDDQCAVWGLACRRASTRPSSAAQTSRILSKSVEGNRERKMWILSQLIGHSALLQDELDQIMNVQ
ncbi:hypothetical protein FIBSPDRAFT_890203 [Athelia psychrophila]|uniref:Uncharacterized protein n=1 Tax=Athelia psychrophila TaxID=1759441 RepID=A0A166L4F3_9AGAM|nr:hypothetical protein FIBSPDRAFT_890203 [Fibularhizoctonia sp. CBS 109695]